MSNIAGYILNLGKSISYSAVDKVEKTIPSIKEFKETNNELFKSVYADITNYKDTYNRTLEQFKKSKVYEAGDVLHKSLMEDIKNGTFYNKQRENNSSYLGLDMNDEDYDIGWDDEGDSSNVEEISDSKASATAVSMAVGKSSEYIVENQKANTNLLFNQNNKGFNMLGVGINNINKNIVSLTPAVKLLETAANNQKTFYENTTKAMNDSIGLLRSINENLNSLKPNPKEEKKRNKKTRFSDITSSGMPDIKAYLGVIKDNIKDQTGALGSMMNMFGEDSNILAELASQPLKFIPDAIVNKVIPDAVNKSANEFNKSIEGLFGSLIAKINGLNDFDKSPISQKIGQVLGISSTYKSRIDTSAYNKKQVAWNGKSEKALIDVIPTYLRKMLSIMNGKPELIYDYERGTFKNGVTVKKDYDNIKKSSINMAGMDLKDQMLENMKALSFNDDKEEKSVKKDIDRLLTQLFEKGKVFDANKKDKYQEYGFSEERFKILQALFRNSEKSTQLEFNKNVLEYKDRLDKSIRDLENKGSIFDNLYNGSGILDEVKLDKDNKVKKRKSTSYLQSPLNIKDNLGHNGFYYLQNIYRELTTIRTNVGSGGTGSNNTTGNGNLSGKIDYFTDNNGNTTVYKKKMDIKEAIIPDKSEHRKEINRKMLSEASSRERYLTSEKERINKHDYIADLKNVKDKNLSANMDNAIKLMKLNKKTKDIATKDKSTFERLYESLLKSETLTEKSKNIVKMVDEVSKKPMDFIENTINKVDERIYNLIYGKKDVDGKDIKGIIDIFAYQMKSTFGQVNLWLEDNILTPLRKKLGLDQISKLKDKIKDTQIYQFFKDKKDAIFNKNDGLIHRTGKAIKDRAKGAFSTVKDSVNRVIDPVKEKLRKKNGFEDLDEITDDYFTETTNKEVKKAQTEREKKHEYLKRLSMKEKIKLAKEKTKKSMDNLQDDLYNTNPFFETDKYQMIQDEMKVMDNKKKNIIKNDKVKNKNRNIMKQYISKMDDDDPRKQSLINDFNKQFPDKPYKTKKDRNKEYRDKINGIKERNLSKQDILSSYWINPQRSKNINAVNKELKKSNRVLSLLENKGNLIDENKKDVEYTDAQKQAFYAKHLRKKTKKEYRKGINTEHKDKELGLASSKNVVKSLDKVAPKISVLDKILSHISKLDENIQKITNVFFKASKKGKRSRKYSIKNKITGIDPAESEAANDFSAQLSKVISNFIHGNISFFAKGTPKPLEKAQAAIIGKGELVIPKNIVDELKNIIEGTNKRSMGKQTKHSNSDAADTANSKLEEILKKASPEEAKLYLNKFSELVEKNEFNDDGATDISKKRAKLINKSVIKRQSKSDEEKEKIKEDSNSLAKKTLKEFEKGAKESKDALFGKDSKNFATAVDDITNSAFKYAPDAIGSGLIGGGVSLVTGAVGGPLLGAAIGAGISLTKNSEAVQNWIFGTKNENGERVDDGLLSKEFLTKAKKFLPDVKAYGITGGLAGLVPFLPFGPVAGLMLGGSFGYLKNNKDFKEALFGNDENGILSKKRKNKLKKMLPRMGAGAAASAIFSPLPFGLLGNAVVGAGVGYLSTTDKFKDIVLGVKDAKGEYQGGILSGLRNHVVEPFKRKFKKISKDVTEFIKTEIFAPIKSAIKPLFKQISVIGKSFKNLFKSIVQKFFESSLGAPIKKLLNSITKPFRWVFGKIGKMIFGFSKKLISAPAKGIGKVGNILRGRQIKKGNANYMTAQERLDFREDHSLFGLFNGDKTKSTDEAIAGLSSESPEKLKELSDKISFLTSSDKKLEKTRKKIFNSMGTDDALKDVGYKKTKHLMHLIQNGKKEDTDKYIASLNLPQDKVKVLMEKINRYNKFSADRTDKKKYQNDMLDALQKAGFTNINKKKISNGNYTGLDQLNDYLKTEIKTNEKEKVENTKNGVENPVKENNEYHNTVVEKFDELIAILRGDKKGINKVNHKLLDEDGITKKDSTIKRDDKSGKLLRYDKKSKQYVVDDSDTITQNMTDQEEKKNKLKKLKENDQKAKENGMRDHNGMLYVNVDGEYKPDLKDKFTRKAYEKANKSIFTRAKEKLFGNRLDDSRNKETHEKHTDHGVVGNFVKSGLEIKNDIINFARGRDDDASQLMNDIQKHFTPEQIEFIKEKASEGKAKGILAKELAKEKIAQGKDFINNTSIPEKVSQGKEIAKNGINKAKEIFSKGKSKTNEKLVTLKNEIKLNKQEKTKRKGLVSVIREAITPDKKTKKKKKNILGKLIAGVSIIGGFIKKLTGGLKNGILGKVAGGASKFGGLLKAIPLAGFMGPLAAGIGTAVAVANAPKIIDFFKGTVVPWVENKAVPWLRDKAIPAIGNGAKAIIKALPSFIIGGFKFLFKNGVPLIMELGKSIVSGIYNGLKELISYPLIAIKNKLMFWKSDKTIKADTEKELSAYKNRQEISKDNLYTSPAEDMKRTSREAVISVDKGSKDNSKISDNLNDSMSYKSGSSKKLVINEEKSNNEVTSEDMAKSATKSVFRNVITGGATGDLAKAGENFARHGKQAAKIADNIIHPFKFMKNLGKKGLNKLKGTKIGAKVAGMKMGVNPVNSSEYASQFATYMNNEAVEDSAENLAKDSSKVTSKAGKAIEKGTGLIGKFGKYAKKAADKVGATKFMHMNDRFSSHIKATTTKKGNELVTKLVNSLREKLTKLLSDGKISKLLGADKCKKLLEKFVPNFISTLEKKLAQNSAKVSAKVAAAVTTGGLLNLAFAVGDFISGYNDARNILGITQEPTWTMKVVSGLIKALNGLFIITSFIPEKFYVNLILDEVLPIFGKDDTEIQDLRKQSQTEVDAYNEKNGTDLSLEEYNEKIHPKQSIFQKMKSGIVGSAKKFNIISESKWLGSKFKGLFNKTKEGAAWLGNKTKEGASWLGNKVQYGVNKTKEGASWLGNKVQYGVNKTKEGAAWLGNKTVDYGKSLINTVSNNGKILVSSFSDAKKNIFGFFSDHFKALKETFANVTDWLGENIGKPLKSMANKAIDKVKGGIKFVGTGLSKAYGKVKQKASDLVAGVKNEAKYIGNSTVSQLVKDAGAGIKNESEYLYNSAKNGISSVGSGIKKLFTGTGGPNKESDNIENDLKKEFLDNSRKPKYNGIGGISHEDFLKYLVKPAQEGYRKYGLFPSYTMAQACLESTWGTSKAAENDKNLFGIKAPGVHSPDANIQVGSGATDDGGNYAKYSSWDDSIEDHGYFLKNNSRYANAFSAKNPEEQATIINDAGYSTTPTSKYVSSIMSTIKANGLDKYDSGVSYEGTGDSDSEDDSSSNGISSFFSGLSDAFGSSVNRMFGIDTDAGNDSSSSSSGSGSADSNSLIEYAKTFLGDPYVYGGTGNPGPGGKPGYDCSGFAQAVYKKFGIDIGRTTYDQVKQGEEVSEEDAKAGDLIFFGSKSAPHHVAIYEGNNQMIEAPRTGLNIREITTKGRDICSYRHIANVQESDNEESEGGIDENLPDNFFKDIEEGIGGPAGNYFSRKLKGNVTSGFGHRNTTGNIPKDHTGIDIGAKKGKEIPAPIGGVVTQNIPANKSKGFGNLVVMKDKNNAEHYFGHMDTKSNVQVGKKVKAGDSLGKVGSTGNSTGPHLHYEVQEHGLPVNPDKYLANYGSMDNKQIKHEIDKHYNKKYSGKGGADNSTLNKVIELLTTIASNTTQLSTIIELISKILNLKTGNSNSTEKKKVETRKNAISNINNKLKNSNNNNNDLNSISNMLSALIAQAQE